MSAPKPTRRRIAGILSLLQRAHGERPWRRWGKGVDVLVGTILSQNTNKANSSAGFRELTRRFSSWDKVADAPVSAIEKCIRVSGLSRVKAPRIRRILRQIRDDRGRIDLEFLKRRPPQEGLDYLMGFTGVGDKTARCVLLFAFGLPVFPVDTHVNRLSRRLGLVPPNSSPEKTQEFLTPLIPPEKRYALHVLLIAHGREICHARGPQCGDCVLSRRCPSARNPAR